MTTVPLPGCCHFCHEPVTRRQKWVLFEGPNLRYPQLGEDTAVFHTRGLCRRDARGYDEAWARAAPERVQKFPGQVTGEALLKLIEISTNADPGAERGVQVCVHRMGGPFDGACMKVSMPREYQELLYTEPIPQPAEPKPAAWYEHATDCPCVAAAGAGRMPAGDHIYRPKPDIEA